MDLVEFQQLALELVRKSYVLSGLESLDSLDLWQLHVLRDHHWTRRELTSIDDEDGEDEDSGPALEGHDNAEEIMDQKKADLGVGSEDGSSTGDAKEDEEPPMYRETLAHKKTFEEISKDFQSCVFFMYELLNGS